jgi:hypothetical protein
MKKQKTGKPDKPDELRAEYDLAPLLKEGVRGKYAAQYKSGTNVVLLDPDVAAAFPTPETVNEALRLVMKLSAIPVTATAQQAVAADSHS